MKQRFIPRFFLIIFAFTTFALNQNLAMTAEKAPTPVPKKRQSRAAYREELGRLIDQNHVNCAVDTDCEALGVGAMACGGPSEFLPVTKATLAKISTSVSDLTRAIEELDQAKNKESSQLGICLALAKPDVKCRSGNCVAPK